MAWKLLTIWLPSIEALNVGISLSMTGHFRSQSGFLNELPTWARPAYAEQFSDGQIQDWPCFWCSRVVDALAFWRLKAQDLAIGLQILDDQSNFSRAMEHYRNMSADPQMDVLFGPALGTWNAYAANIVTSAGKIMVTWSLNYDHYLSDYRTELCPYCRAQWFQETDWVTSMSQVNSSAFTIQRPVQATPSGNNSFLSSLTFDGSQAGFDAVVNNAKIGIRAIHRQIMLQASSSTWMFAFIRGPASDVAACRDFQAYADALENTTTSLVAFEISENLGDPLGSSTGVDVIFLCTSANWLGESFIQSSAGKLKQKALILERPAGIGKIFSLGAFQVNHVMEPLPTPAILPTASDGLYGTLEAYAAELGYVPDVAGLQVSVATSLLTQALRRRTNPQEVVAIMKSANIQTFFGRYGHPLGGTRQFLASNSPTLQQFTLELAAGPLNSNAMLVQRRVAFLCKRPVHFDKLICQNPVLGAPAYPMPTRSERFQESYLCPEGTSLESLSCQPCRAGYHRQEGMLHCQACQENYYINVAGASSCLPCPSESTSCQPDKTPTLLPGYFTHTGDYAFFSNSTKNPALSDFVFGFEGYFNYTDQEASVTKVAVSGLRTCADGCFLDPDCDGFSYRMSGGECLHVKEFVNSNLEQIPMEKTYHYWKQSQLEALNLSQLSPANSREFPVNTSGLEFAPCFVPTPCAGDTSCRTAGNTGFMCSACLPGFGVDAFFPASRMCTLCPSAVAMHLRIWALILLKVSMVWGLFLSARSVAKGSLSLTVPAVKLLLYHLMISSMVLDMNFFLVSGFLAQVLRYPLEFTLQPWLLMQVDCIHDVLPFLPTDGKTGPALLIFIQQFLGFYTIVFVFSVAFLQSLSVILKRLESFFSMKLPDYSKENLRALNASSTRSPEKEMKSEASTVKPARTARRNQSKDTIGNAFNDSSFRRMMGRYYWMHFQFNVLEEVRSCIRRMTVIAFFLLPVYLRSLVIPWRCEGVGSSGYVVNVEYPGLFCDSQDIADLRYNERFLWILVAQPVISLLILLFTYNTRNDVPTLEALAFLTAGLKSATRWWFVALELRVSSLLFLMSILEGSLLRNLIILFLSVFYALAEIQVNPWVSAHNMVLNKASLALNVAQVLLSTVAAWNGMGLTAQNQSLQEVVVTLVLIPTCLCFAYGIILLCLCLFTQTFFGKMQVLLDAGGITGTWTRAIFFVTAWCVGNLFVIEFRPEGGRYVLDHSRLNALNRRQLLTMLVNLIHECLARHGRFRLRMVEVMLVIAFERAMQVRRGLLNHNFHKHGHTFHSLTYMGFPKVLSPDPDLSPLMDFKVTLAELQDALETLTQDINRGDPELIFRSSMGDKDQEVQSKGQDDYQQEHRRFMVWEGNFQEIEGKILAFATGFAEETAANPELSSETHSQLLKRLTETMQLLCKQYQREVDGVAQGFEEQSLEALERMGRVDAEDRKSRRALAEQILKSLGGEEPGPKVAAKEEEGSEGELPEGEPEASVDKPAKADHAVERVVLGAKELLQKVKAWEEAAESYFAKARERLPKVCAGEDAEATKDWEKNFRDAKSASCAAQERLEIRYKAWTDSKVRFKLQLKP